jgi:hypothetical protein
VIEETENNRRKQVEKSKTELKKFIKDFSKLTGGLGSNFGHRAVNNRKKIGTTKENTGQKRLDLALEIM